MTNAGGQSDYPLAVRPAQQTDLPPGYPQEYRRLVTLHDRRSVLIRPVLPSDAPGLAESIESADADTIYRRFLGGRPQVTPGLLEFLTTVDYASRFALVAVDTASRRGVAIARYEPAEQHGAADVAIAVILGWRGVGLASELLHVLAQARRQGHLGRFARLRLRCGNCQAAAGGCHRASLIIKRSDTAAAVRPGPTAPFRLTALVVSAGHTPGPVGGPVLPPLFACGMRARRALAVLAWTGDTSPNR
jgi:hypothetical protein